MAFRYNKRGKPVGKKPPLGQGGRFSALKAALRGKGVRKPGALAAAIGRRKYGKRRMSRWAAAGRKR